MIRSRLLILIALSTVMSIGCVNRAAQNQATHTEQLISDPTKPVLVTPVKVQTVVDRMEITGELTTADDVSVAAKNPGRLTSVFVKDGDAVSKGQLLAVQDTSNQQLQLQQALSTVAGAQANLAQAVANARIGPSKSTAGVLSAQATLRSAKSQYQKTLSGARPEEKAQATAQVASAKSALDTAKKELDRKRTLQTEGAISLSELDQAQNVYEGALAAYQSAQQNLAMQNNWSRPEDIQAAKEQVQVAQEGVMQARAAKSLDSLLLDQVASAKAALQTAMSQVQIARQAINDANIRAPFAGRVSGKPAQAGSVPGAGNAIVHIIGGAGTYFEGQVSENDIQKVHAGSAANITLDSLPGRTFAGHIANIGPSASTVGRLFTVRVQLDSNSPDVKPGMFARGNVTVSRIDNATVVPAVAIVQKPDGSYIFVVNGNKAHMLKVQIGIKQGDFVQVKGVSPGEKVITTGQADLVEGSPIKLDATQQVAAITGA